MSLEINATSRRPSDIDYNALNYIRKLSERLGSSKAKNETSKMSRLVGNFTIDYSINIHRIIQY